MYSVYAVLCTDAKQNEQMRLQCGAGHGSLGCVFTLLLQASSILFLYFCNLLFYLNNLQESSLHFLSFFLLKPFWFTCKVCFGLSVRYKLELDCIYVAKLLLYFAVMISVQHRNQLRLAPVFHRIV